ncbi:MAG: aminopeptidase, partial [Mariniblastus sp.]|nr:aminopeptidase [Mariniblastus sp.]
ILRVHYADNTSETMNFPAEIWRSNSKNVSKMLITDKEIVRLELDPKQETADTESSNNHWPPRLVPSRFRLFKDGPSRNPMQKAREATKANDKKTAEPETKDQSKPDSNSNKKDTKGKSKPSGKANTNASE